MITRYLSDSERSEQLKIIIAEKIQKAAGRISFTDYMESVLYTPTLGYYMVHPRIFGATEQTGDFITAPEISPLFGQTLAQACHKILKEMPEAVILELGAGSGKLALDLMQSLEALGTPPQAYWILDPSPILREKQQELLNSNNIQCIKWLEKLPDTPFCGIIIANEVLDAMPVQRFKITPNECFETYVKYKNGIFQDDNIPTEEPAIQILAEKIRQQIPSDILQRRPYESERLPALTPFFQSLFSSLEQGAIFLIDYGFPQHEFYHPDRYMGTLMCHYQQRANIDPYQHLGLQDITAHVDFTDVAERAVNAGFALAGYTQQSAFLMNSGLLSLIQTNLETHSIHSKNAIHLLTSPSEMGELFKVMALTKELDIYPFPGFEQFDKRHTL